MEILTRNTKFGQLNSCKNGLKENILKTSKQLQYLWQSIAFFAY